MIEKANALNLRSLRDALFTIGFWSNFWVLIAITSTILLQIAAFYVPALQSALDTAPLAGKDGMVIVVVAWPVFGLVEAIKTVVCRRQSSERI